MPIIFNDWVTHWDDTSHDKLISLANSLKDTNVKYFVVDDGWQTRWVGDWTVDTEKFPNGIKKYAEEIRDMGMIHGIWMEFESVRDRTKRWAKEYDYLCLTKDGIPINNAASNCAPTKFLDFRKNEVINYLDKVVTGFLKENKIGYLTSYALSAKNEHSDNGRNEFAFLSISSVTELSETLTPVVNSQMGKPDIQSTRM